MIQLRDLTKQKYVDIKCKLSYLAISIPLNENYQEQYKNHDFSETALAYLVHKKTAIENYLEVEKEISPFLQDEVNNYDKKLIENRLRDYILFSKISLDLLVSLVKLLLDGRLPENKYPDIANTTIKNEEIKKIFGRLVKDDWFKELKKTRDRLIHRGYQMRCGHKTVSQNRIRTVKFSLAKENLSIIKTPLIDKKYLDNKNDLRGIAITASREEIVDLDLIIEGYINKLPMYEEELYTTLVSQIDFKNKISDYELGFSPLDLEKVDFN